MAKSDTKKSRKKAKKAAKPRTDDAVRLAALRWLAMKIEQLGIEIYVTNRERFDAVEEALREQVRALQAMGGRRSLLEEGDCPGGFILCRDGLCAPMCDDEEPPPEPAHRKRQGRNR